MGIRHSAPDGLAWLLAFAPSEHLARSCPSAGSSRETGARRLVDHIKADVERGVWRPRTPETERDADPTFHVWASDWWHEKRNEALQERTRDWYEWALQGHLLPYCHDRRLSGFDVPYVKKLRSHLRDKRWPSKPYTGPAWDERGECPPGKVPDARRLSASSVNDILSVLSTILESARQDELIDSNAAAAKGTRAKVERRAKLGTWLDYDQVVALLDASQDIDLTSSHYPNLGRRAFNGSLYLGALRVSEACKLERRDVNWERGTIRIRDAKTSAGYRDVPMHRMLFDVMAEWWTRHSDTRPKALLFPTANGTPRNKDNAHERVLLPAVRRAGGLLEERRQNPMPERTNKRGESVPNVQTHSGRRSAITWWAEAGYDEREVMNWVGHEDAALTLRVYRQARNRPKDQRVLAAMAEVPEAERGAPRRLRAV
jgi:integrase